MPFHRIAAAVLGLAVISSCVDIAWTTDKKHVVLFDEGGWIQWYDDQVKDLTARGIRPLNCAAGIALPQRCFWGYLGFAYIQRQNSGFMAAFPFSRARQRRWAITR